MYRYQIKQFKDVDNLTPMCCDPSLSQAELVSYTVALNLRMIPRDTINFGNKDEYPFVDRGHEVIVDTGEQR